MFKKKDIQSCAQSQQQCAHITAVCSNSPQNSKFRSLCVTLLVHHTQRDSSRYTNLDTRQFSVSVRIEQSSCVHAHDSSPPFLTQTSKLNIIYQQAQTTTLQIAYFTNKTYLYRMYLFVASPLLHTTVVFMYANCANLTLCSHPSKHTTELLFPVFTVVSKEVCFFLHKLKGLKAKRKLINFQLKITSSVDDFRVVHRV